MFCDGPSEQIVAMLRNECDAARVRWLRPVRVEAVAHGASGFELATTAGAVQAHRLVVATGGLSIPKIGATDFGYRLARRFGVPVVSLVDTSGAFPGVQAEERGQAEAIARSTEKCLTLGVPLISVVIGEGGSGGAVAFATANRVAMLEHSVYSVISPEGCASILWKDAEKMREAAEALKLTAQDLKKLGVIDSIIPEPLGGAQRERDEAIRAVGDEVARLLSELQGRKPAELIRDRRQKYLDMGARGLAA